MTLFRVLLTECLPFFMVYQSLAILVTMPNTRWIRLGLMGIAVPLGLKALFQWDLSGGDTQYGILNYIFGCTACLLTMNTVVWGLKDKSYKRLDGPQETFYDALVNGFDLALDVTAISWEHGVANRALEGKKEVRSRTQFILSRILSAGKGLLFNAAISTVIIRLLSSPGHGSPQTTIFHADLPPLWRYLKGCLISILVALSIPGGMQLGFDMVAVTAVLLGSSPTKWPPTFRSPWCSTSVSSFWGYRWHQATRLTFLHFAGKPLAAITGTGRLGLVMGTFIASGIAHEAGAMRIPTARAKEGQGALLFFTMQGVGVVLEHLWTKVTGRRVRGVPGWLWTVGWLTVWGNDFIDRSVRIGMLGILPEKLVSAMRPSAAAL